MSPDRIAQQHLNDMRRALGATPPELTPEQAAWDALTKAQRRFILRGLGIDPDTMQYRTLTIGQRQAFRQAVEGWAQCAGRLTGIIASANAEVLRRHAEVAA